MFEYLAPYRSILVTGPHRSGTTIAAHMIAQDTGKGYVDEYATSQGEALVFERLVDFATNVVIQAPAAFEYLTELDRADLAIVFMVRNRYDVLVSMERMFGESNIAIIDDIHARWAQVKQRLANPFEVRYDDLAQHPLWVGKENRIGWSIKQWR